MGGRRLVHDFIEATSLVHGNNAMVVMIKLRSSTVARHPLHMYLPAGRPHTRQVAAYAEEGAGAVRGKGSNAPQSINTSTCAA